MGYYVNPSDGSDKETWLAKNGRKITPTEAKQFTFGGGALPVCLVDNGAFTAAGIAYDARERDCFASPDGRPKVWYVVPLAALAEFMPA
jgi:hypothetical protein